LWLSKLFYERIRSTTTSRLGNLLRTLFVLGWALAVLFTFSSLNFMVMWILPSLLFLVGRIPMLAYILALIYPFPFGYVLAWIQNPLSVEPGLLLFATCSSGVYIIFCYLWIRRVARVIYQVTVSGFTIHAPNKVKPISFKPTMAWQAIIKKDLKIISRTPAYASLLLLPFSFLIPFIPQIITVQSFNLPMVYAYVSVVSFGMLAIANLWLSIEATGMEYTITLPISTRMVIRAKALFTVTLYFINLLFIIGFTFFLELEIGLAFILILVEGINVFSGVLVSLSLISWRIGDGHLAPFTINQNMKTNILSLFIGFVYSMLAFAFYTASLFMGLDVLVGVACMLGASLLLLGLAEALTKKVLQD
ncbi:MAG: hypothetical protein ACTSVM_00540, partial [Candidatus Ranarchaeia archaeon]